MFKSLDDQHEKIDNDGPVTVKAELFISYCPWCGREVSSVYNKNQLPEREKQFDNEN